MKSDLYADIIYTNLTKSSQSGGILTGHIDELLNVDSKNEPYSKFCLDLYFSFVSLMKRKNDSRNSALIFHLKNSDSLNMNYPEDVFDVKFDRIDFTPPSFYILSQVDVFRSPVEEYRKMYFINNNIAVLYRSYQDYISVSNSWSDEFTNSIVAYTL